MLMEIAYNFWDLWASRYRLEKNLPHVSPDSKIIHDVLPGMSSRNQEVTWVIGFCPQGDQANQPVLGTPAVL